ncbi:hypothetical protein DVH24_016962 [Malus domestica]|uniref:F-box associated beta-propeller type 3 domain-containing protein n=1 Tax=Malus domestica TaxID=3750 RepID=A0A498IRR7_MALDO|nr:hypothetical protein DVH24_016962 [Malus domestica]
MFPVVPPTQMCSNTRNIKPKTLMDLPMDILVDILMKLQPAIESLSQFRCVSKTALNFIDSPFFAQLHTSRLLNSAASCAATVQVPQLILLAEFDGPNLKTEIGLQLHPFKYTPDARHDDTSAIVFKHALPNWKISCGAFQYDVSFVFCNLIGFKAKFTSSSSCYLFDALRGEVLQLPLLPLVLRNPSPFNTSSYTLTWYGMGFDNISCTYKIVCVSTWSIREDLEAHVYTLGASATTSSWRQIHSVPPRVLSYKNVSAYGDMHWFIYPSQSQKRSHSNHAESCIISFDFKKEEFVWTSHPNLHGFVSLLFDMHLLNLRGSLAIVDFSDHGSDYGDEKYVDIWVLKDYSKKKKEWTMDYKIKTPRILTISISAIGEWEHGIFFTCYNFPDCYFLDLRNKSALLRSFSSYKDNYWGGKRKTRMIMYSYTKSLISLKNYGNLLERKRMCKWAVFEAAKTSATRFFEAAKTSPWGIFEAAKTNAQAFSEATSMWHFETLRQNDYQQKKIMK